MDDMRGRKRSNWGGETSLTRCTSRLFFLKLLTDFQSLTAGPPIFSCREASWRSSATAGQGCRSDTGEDVHGQV